MADDTQTIALIGAAFLIILLLVLILIRQSRSYRISAAQIEQLELGIGLGQKLGQGVDGRHEEIPLEDNAGDYKGAAPDSQRR